MTTRPLISIIIPSLNQGGFLPKTLESVLSQTYSQFECLVIDGGSTDETLDLLRATEARVRWLSEPDDGQSAAINKGWRLAHGEIIAYLNADDLYLPQTLEQVADFFQQHPSVDAVYGAGDYIDHVGRLLGAYPTRPYHYQQFVYAAVNYILQPAMFLRQRVLESAGYLDESLTCVMDFDYWLRLGLAHQVVHLPERWAQLRLHRSAKSLTQLNRFAVELIQIYQQLFARPDLPPAVRGIYRPAMSNVHYRASACAFWGGDYTQAQRYAWRGWQYAPWNLQRQFLLAMWGPAGRVWAERWRGHPFTLGLTE